MERDYRHSEFEHFLKDNADEYRMFPSEKVWKGINSNLHTRRKWYGLGLAFLLLLTGGAVTWVMTAYPGSKKENTPLPQAGLLAKINQPSSPVDEKNIEDIIPFRNTPPNTTNPLFNEKATAGMTEGDIKDPVALTTESRNNDYTALAEKMKVREVKTDQPATFTLTDPAAEVLQANQLADVAFPLDLSRASAFTPKQLVAPYPAEISIENASRGYRAPKKKVSWQIFITPTISYRRLSENKDYSLPVPIDPGSSPNLPFTLPDDVNSAVTHRPDMGLQLGLSGRYPVSKRISIRGGIQANINRYDIKAFRYNGELATINLNGANNGVVSTWTYYRSQDGYNSNWLKNYYLSVSAPVGIEAKLAGNKKTTFGVAGTIQPTYVISDRAYLLSSDYKNYAEVPSLIRRTNVSAGFEAFINYNSKGGAQWQVGPQARYQMLSSFKNTYPVKENLFDFGLKIGLTLNND